MTQRFILAILVLILPLPVSAADLTVTYQIKEGKKNKGEKTVYYTEQFQLTKDSSSKIDVLTDYGSGAIYTIDHGQKQIEVLNLKELGGMMGGANQMMGQMMAHKMPKGDKTMGESIEEKMTKYMGDPNKAVLQRLGTLTIAGRTCDNYKVERKGPRIEMSEEVCIDPTLIPPQNPNFDATQIQEAAQEMQGALGNLQSVGQKELAGIKGLPLRRIDKSKTKMLFGGGTHGMDEEATRVQEGPVDPAVFKLPVGYKQIDQAQAMREEMLKMQKMMGEMER